MDEAAEVAKAKATLEEEEGMEHPPRAMEYHKGDPLEGVEALDMEPLKPKVDTAPLKLRVDTAPLKLKADMEPLRHKVDMELPQNPPIKHPSPLIMEVEVEKARAKEEVVSI